MIKKTTTQLRDLITSSELDFMMEAHNGLSAKLVEEAGFKAVWGSGLTLSASLGVRDNNEASWTQVLDMLEFMSDAIQIPILLDGDTGYGNFNNMRRLVKKLEQRHIAGVCIEDKLFPKTNSFISGPQPLAETEEFCGKIKAAKDTQTDPDFVVVARTEAFISGWGVDEALRRAEAYRAAGADAILVHSKKSTPIDIELFMDSWKNKHPVIVVPTTYYSTPTERFQELGINTVIWANHSLRTSITAIRKTLSTIYQEKALHNVEDKVASVQDVFKLQGMEELKEAEKKYMAPSERKVKGVILAAAQGKELGDLTENIPKTLLTLHSKTILDSIVEVMNQINITDITVVRGFQKDLIQGHQFRTIDNLKFQTTQDLYSLYLVKDQLTDTVVVTYGDNVFRKYLLTTLLENSGSIKIVVDADQITTKSRDHVICSQRYSNDFFNQDIYLKDICYSKEQVKTHGVWPGILMVEKEKIPCLKEALDVLYRKADFNKLSVVDLIQYLSQKEKVSVIYTKGGWVGVNDLDDFMEARKF